MATTSTNLSLTLPVIADTTKIVDDFNDNFNIIDGRFSATYMAVQAAASVAITGGSITGITDITVADGGTGSSTAANARTALGAASRALDNISSCAINTALLLGSSDGGALGSATKMWSDLFLASGGVIYFNNTDVTLTHSSNTLTLGGTTTLALGATSITMTGSLADTTNRVTKGWFTDLQVTNSIAGSITGTAAVATTITVADESADTENFILFTTTATGNLAPKSGTNLTFNSSTGDLIATKHGGITEANLVDKSATETVSGAWTFSGTFIKSGSAALTLRRVDDDATDDAHLHFQRKQTTSPYNVENADELGHIAWYGWHTSYNYAACIKATVDGTPGSGDMPTKMTFLTSADASATPTLAMTIDSSQVVTFANALANGTAATTQTASDNSTKLSTTAYVDAAVGAAGGGDVSKVGTPANDQVGVWTGDGTIEGDTSFTYASGTGTATVAALVIDGTTAKGIDITGANTTAQLYIAGTNILANGEQAIWVNCPSEDGATNGMWISLGSTVTSGDVTGARIKVTTNATTGGASAGGQQTRGIYTQAIAAANDDAGQLIGGQFCTDVSAGSCVVYNAYALYGHHSAGTGTTIGGDLFVGLLKSQTVETSARTVTGIDGILQIENEAKEGTGSTIDVGIHFKDNVVGDGFTYGIDFTGADIATAEIRLQNGETISNTTDGLIELGGEVDMNAHTIGFTQQTATGDGTTTIDWKLGNKFYFTFGAQADTFTFTAPTNPCNLILVLKQDGTGSRTATWPVSVKWPAGTAPTLTTAGNAVDVVAFYWDGTNYHGTSSLAFAVPA